MASPTKDAVDTPKTNYAEPRSAHRGESQVREDQPESNWERRARTAEAKLDAMEAAIHSLLKQFGK